MLHRRLIKVAEAAIILDVTEERAYELGRKGLLPIVHLGRQVRVDLDKLAAFIDAGGASVTAV